MEILRILFALAFLAPGYYAMEIQPPVLPRNLDVYCKFCDGLSAVFDNFSYEDYDFWRTIDIQEKVKFFCSFCKNKTESTTTPTTTSEPVTTPTMTSQSITPSMTTTTSPQPESSSVPTSAPSASETPTSSTGTPSSSTENSSPSP